MDSGAISDGCKQELHGRHCPGCRHPGRVKDRRVVVQIKPDGHGGAVRLLVLRLRLQCWTPGCDHWKKSWTTYEEGGYPRRRFTLSLAVAAVAALEEDAEGSLSSVARRLRCNRRTVGRLVRWVGAIGTVKSIEEKCTQVEPTTIIPTAPRPFAPPSPPRPPFALEVLALAGHLARCLEHLASLLRGRGVALEHGPGLAALLRCQFDRWGEVLYLTSRAPPQLRIPWPPGAPAS